MADVVIRLARPEELAETGAMTVDAYHADGVIDSPTGGYADVLGDAVARARDAELLIAVGTEGALLGTVTVALPGTPYAEIAREGELEFRMLAVTPAARGRGVGMELVQAVISRACELGLPGVVLSSSTQMITAHRLYRRLGFQRLPERDWSPMQGVDLVAFEHRKDL
jgi:ribosomal protein S18 acetylase RimI-like enzyme